MFEVRIDDKHKLINDLQFKGCAKQAQYHFFSTTSICLGGEKSTIEIFIINKQ